MDTDAEKDNSVRSGRRFKERVQSLFFKGTIVGLVAFGICVVGLGIAKFVMGIIYLDDCELQPFLPVYLIVEFCMALMFFIVIVVSMYQSEKEEKSNTTDEFSTSRLLVCLVSVLVPLFLFIWFIVGTVWVVNVREEINAPGHCNYTTTTSPIATTSAWNFTTTASTQNPVSLGSSLGSLSSATNPLEAATTSAAISHCSTCDETFVNFTFGVVIAQWAIVGAIFATILAALFMFGCVLFLCSAIGG